MSTADLIARVLAARERWVDLDERRAVRVRRPSEVEMLGMGRDIRAEKLAQCVVGWRGFTLADAIGEGDSAIEFDSELWRVLSGDRADWTNAVAVAVGEDISKHFEQREAARGNLPPS